MVRSQTSIQFNSLKSPSNFKTTKIVDYFQNDFKLSRGSRFVKNLLVLNVALRFSFSQELQLC